MELRGVKSVHLVGIGGINMSAVAKILQNAGVKVSGSDAVQNEQTDVLSEMGATVAIGHSATNIPQDAEAVIYSSAVPSSNVEREEAGRRDIREMTNFEFLGEWYASKKMIVVAGTHGKSTTTAMLGLMLERTGLDPTVVVGSKVPSFENGNLRIGASDLLVVEGDEYAKHFLAFRPFGLLLNNIELDHTDIFPTIDDMRAAFRELLSNVVDAGIVVANVGDANVASLVKEAEERVRVVAFNGADASSWVVTNSVKENVNELKIEKPGIAYTFILHVPGSFNALNAAGAALMARELGASYPDIGVALESFKGIWRRFELLEENDGAKYFSDYGHHPTAVSSTLKAAKQQFPSSRILLCFQPHHRNRTKHLFLDFVPSFDDADILVLCEIYDVAGRDASEDAEVSSKDLVDAIVRHDADRSVSRLVEYAPDPASAVERIRALAKPGDIVIIMGAGDIDAVARGS